MTVGILRAELVLPGVRSLKEKRRILSSLLERLRSRFPVSVSEVDHQDAWGRTAIGVAMVGSDGGIVRGTLDEILRRLRAPGPAELASHEIEFA